MKPAARSVQERPALVLGASGFIGRWVARDLQNRGLRTVCVVRSEQRAREVLGGGVELVSADFEAEGAAAEVIAGLKPGVVFNLAGYGVDKAERDDALAVRLNTSLVVEAAGAAAELPEKERPAFIHVGSALEYGISRGVLAEDTFPRPTTLYGRTKLAGTLALASICRNSGLRGVTARLFTVFGEGEHLGRLFPSLVAASEAGETLKLSSGQQRRDFAWVGEVARLLYELSQTAFLPGEVVNLASGRMYSVREFALECARQLGMDKSLLEFGALPVRPEEMEHEGVSVERLRTLVGRTAEPSLERAIAQGFAGSL